MLILFIHFTIYIASLAFCNLLALYHARILGIPFDIHHTLMPSVAGLVFGFMIASIYNYSRHLKKEKHIVANLNDDINTSIGIIAHDLKAPASGVFSLSQIIKDKQSHTFSEEEISEMLYSSSKSILSSIDEIMSVIKFKSSDKKKIKVDNPSHDIESCIDIFKASARQKNILINSNIDSMLHPIKYNFDIIRDILSNLIGNAIKYSYPESSVAITADNVKVNNSHHVKISVRDKGQGLHSDDLKKIFSKFQRLSSTPLHGESSTGLGLWIVKNLVESLAGSVTAESKGKKLGSTFSVFFPIAKTKDKKFSISSIDTLHFYLN